MKRALALGLSVSLLAGGFIPSVGVSAASPIVCTPTAVDVPDLMYHRISVPPADAPLKDLWVDPTVFRATMKYLHKNGWRTLKPKQVAWRVKACKSIPEKTFTITIDDGNRDGYDNAYPVLQEFGFKAAFAVVAGRVSVARLAFTWEMLAELQASGHEIANHTMDHDDLRAEDAEGLYYEIELANQLFFEHLGILPRTFVYPYGRWDDEAVAQVRASRFWLAYTTYYGCTYSHNDRFLEERVRVNRNDTPKRVLAKMQSC